MTAVEVLDVARHGPLEVDHARAGAAAATTAAAAAACEAAAAAGGRDVRSATHRDRDLDGRRGAVPVEGFYGDGVGRLHGHIEGDPIVATVIWPLSGLISNEDASAPERL